MKITGIGQGYMVKTKYPCLSFGTDSIGSSPNNSSQKESDDTKSTERVFLSYHFIMGPEYKSKTLPYDDHLVLGYF